MEDSRCCLRPFRWLPPYGCLYITQKGRSVAANKEKCDEYGAMLFEEEDPAMLLAFANALERIPGVFKGWSVDGFSVFTTIIKAGAEYSN